MLNSNFVGRIGLLVCGVGVFVHAGAAHAQSSCAGTYKEAQGKETAGQLLEARDLYFSCAKPACGAFLLNECTTRHARLDLDVPSVVPVAKHKSGKPYLHVRVSLDGESFASSLDGRSLQVDPGMHEFTFTAESGVSITENVLIVQGDRNRVIAVTMPGKPRQAEEEADTVTAVEAPRGHDGATDSSALDSADHVSSAPVETPNEVAPSKGPPTLAWVLGGVGVLGGAGYVLLSTWGKKDNDALQRQCAPNCQPSSVDRVKQRYLMADISLGVGVAAFGSAILAYALRGSHEEAVPAQQAYTVDVQPTLTGGVARFTGAF